MNLAQDVCDPRIRISINGFPNLSTTISPPCTSTPDNRAKPRRNLPHAPSPSPPRRTRPSPDANSESTSSAADPPDPQPTSPGVESFLFGCSLSVAKPYGDAHPVCMLDEFDLPASLVDYRVTEMRIISPSNLTVLLRQDPEAARIRRYAPPRGPRLLPRDGSGTPSLLRLAIRRPLHERRLQTEPSRRRTSWCVVA